MASLKEIRTRITSVKSTRQITSAMKMVSAAKLRQAQDAIILMRPYASKLQEILVNLTASLDEEQDNVYGNVREVNKALLILISSNKGLCGGFNANVSKKAIELISTEYKELYDKDKIDIMAIGKKAADLLIGKGYKPTENQHDLLDNLAYNIVKSLAKRIMVSYKTGIYDEVKIIYNQFKNAAVQELVVEQYLPVVSTAVEDEEQKDSCCNYILEPSKEQIIKDLIPKSLKIQLYKAFLDSVASEHGARMTAMHKATDNATDLIRELQLDYNRERQASITNEILEIVGGAEALKK
ncbi:MAG: ATP synthase F1 subunit gamma [Bacteroidales bacterium]|nr:ATP synthase F1 subunit gamma [Bacteroidales bacterium]